METLLTLEQKLEIQLFDWKETKDYLSHRTRVVLKKYEINTIGDILAKKSIKYFSKLPGFGKETLNQIKELIAAKGLEFGMELPPPKDKTLPFSNEMKDLLSQKMVDMNISLRTENCLNSANIETLGELVSFSKDQLLKMMRNFGKKSLTELEDLVDKKGLKFGMDISKFKQLEEEPKKQKMINRAVMWNDYDKKLEIDIDFAIYLQVNNIIWIDAGRSTVQSHPYILNTTTEELNEWDGWWVVTGKLFCPSGTIGSVSNESVLEIEVAEMHDDNGLIQERFKGIRR